MGARGGTGRRATLRSLWGDPWRFESSRTHQIVIQVATLALRAHSATWKKADKKNEKAWFFLFLDILFYTLRVGVLGFEPMTGDGSSGKLTTHQSNKFKSA